MSPLIYFEIKFCQQGVKLFEHFYRIPYHVITACFSLETPSQVGTPWIYIVTSKTTNIACNSSKCMKKTNFVHIYIYYIFFTIRQQHIIYINVSHTCSKKIYVCCCVRVSNEANCIIYFMKQYRSKRWNAYWFLILSLIASSITKTMN